MLSLLADPPSWAGAAGLFVAAAALFACARLHLKGQQLRRALRDLEETNRRMADLDPLTGLASPLAFSRAL